LAEEIADKSVSVLIAAKKATNFALDSALNEGLVFERKLFNSLVNQRASREGINSFLGKRKPKFDDM
jgi:enoyl-CoA hydratase/carnithine racemase